MRCRTSAATVEKVQIDQRRMQYLYQEGDLYTFMDTKTYEQVALSKDSLEDALPYLMPNLELRVGLYEGEPIGVELPVTVDLDVVETEPAVKGATASASTKPAILETGLVVQVPPFVSEGDKVRVDTSTGAYLTRAG